MEYWEGKVFNKDRGSHPLLSDMSHTIEKERKDRRHRENQEKKIRDSIKNISWKYLSEGKKEGLFQHNLNRSEMEIHTLIQNELEGLKNMYLS